MSGNGVSALTCYRQVRPGTDARAVSGLNDAVERANLALTAGADMAFVEAIPTLDELAEVPRRVNGPCLLNVVRGGKTHELILLDA